MAEEVKLDRKQIRELEKEILKRVESIIFSERNRPSGKQKVNGGLLVEDDTGKLRRQLKANRGFVKQNKRGGIEVDIKMVSYFKWLDDERRQELNWYFSEAIFEDKIISDKIKELYTESVKSAFIKIGKKEGFLYN